VNEELAKLESERTIRVLDLLFVARDTDSDDVVVLEHPGSATCSGSRRTTSSRMARGLGPG
jgi:hypothetical protein